MTEREDTGDVLLAFLDHAVTSVSSIERKSPTVPQCLPVARKTHFPETFQRKPQKVLTEITSQMRAHICGFPKRNSMKTSLSCIPPKFYILVEENSKIQDKTCSMSIGSGTDHFIVKYGTVPWFKALFAATPELDSGRMDDNQLNDKHTWMFANTQLLLLLLSVVGDWTLNLQKEKKNPKTNYQLGDATTLPTGEWTLFEFQYQTRHNINIVSFLGGKIVQQESGHGKTQTWINLSYTSKRFWHVYEVLFDTCRSWVI